MVGTRGMVGVQVVGCSPVAVGLLRRRRLGRSWGLWDLLEVYAGISSVVTRTTYCHY